MKLNVLIILLAVSQVYGKVSYSQTATLSLNLQNATVKKVLEEIESQSEFYFMYSSNQIDLEKQVNVTATEKKINYILSDLFEGTDTYFAILDKQIVLSPKDVLFREIQELQKLITISGKVTDIDGEGIPGVNIQEKSTGKGTVTNVDGTYAMSEVPNDGVLTFSFIGYEKQEIPVDNRTTIDITLLESSEFLDEVVVVAYGTQKKANLTGSVASVTTKDLLKAPTPNILHSLGGRLSGLVAVQNSGEPGRDGTDTTSISIRGFGYALVIVDGVESTFSQLDPNDIESISILKDASSAAAYGVRGGNGVLLVTTKRGKKGEPKFSYSSYYGIQTPTRYPELLDAVEYMELWNEGLANEGLPPDYDQDDIDRYKSGELSSTDWFDETVRKYTPMSQHNLNVSGGSDNVGYFLSLGYLDQEGMWAKKSTEFKRYNLRSNIDAYLTENFTVSFDLSGRVEDRTYPGLSSSSIMNNILRSRPMAKPWDTENNRPLVAGNMYKGNPLAATDPDYSGSTDDSRKSYNGKLSFKYGLPWVEGMNVKAMFSYTNNNWFKKDWKKQYRTYEQSGNGYFDNETTELTEKLEQEQFLTIQYSLNYGRVFNDAHSIRILALYEETGGKGNWFEAYRKNYVATSIDQLFFGGDEGKDNDGSAWESGDKGFVGRINYDYKGKYLVEISVRRDASYKFPSDTRWGTFPAFSAGWRISEEKFFKNNLPFVENMKIRGSWGKLGTYGKIGAFDYLFAYEEGGDYIFDIDNEIVETGIKASTLANQNVTWEKHTTSNIGFDLLMWQNKLGVQFDWFYRHRSDVLGKPSASVPYNFGGELPYANVNEYDNRGFELVLTHRNTIRSVEYYVSGNASWTREKIVKFEEEPFANANLRLRNEKSGKWANRYFGYEALGIFSSQEEIDNWAIQDGSGNSTINIGDIKYLDYNEDGILNYEDEHAIGRGTETPEFMYGLDIGFSYKGFDFSMFWQGATNFNRYVDGEMAVPFYNDANTVTELLDRWHKDPSTGEWISGKYPATYVAPKDNNGYKSSFWLKDATYLRLKTLSLGYTFPAEIINKLKIDQLRIYVTGQNLLTFDKIKYLDPELGSSRGFYYPQQKVVNIGLNVTF